MYGLCLARLEGAIRVILPTRRTARHRSPCKQKMATAGPILLSGMQAKMERRSRMIYLPIAKGRTSLDASLEMRIRALDHRWDPYIRGTVTRGLCSAFSKRRAHGDRGSGHRDLSDTRADTGTTHAASLHAVRGRAVLARTARKAFRGGLERAQLIGHHDLARPQPRAENLPDVRQEGRRVHRPFERHRRHDAAKPQPHDQRAPSPLTALRFRHPGTGADGPAPRARRSCTLGLPATRRRR